MVDGRILQPLRSLTSQPSITARVTAGSIELLTADSTLPRLLIWQRPLLTLPESLAQLRVLLRNGYVIVSEYDDDPDRWPAIAAHQHLVFRGVHAVQVSTEPLAAAIRPHNPELAVFANALAALPQPTSFPAEGGGPLRLFFGALNREADWAPWIGALNRVFAAAPERWQVEVVHDRAFNRCKSDLKAIEAGGHGLAILASPVVYGGSLQDGEKGRLFTTDAQLEEILQGWLANPAAAQAMGLRARQSVASSRLQQHQAPARQAWYRSLWERREKLTAQLLERVPQLRL